MYSTGAVVIGTGFIGRVHIEALKRLGVPVIGVFASNAEKTEQARREFGLEKGYSTYEEVLEDEAVGSVHLAVPNDLHFEMARQALKARKHVLCEKPLAMNTEQTAELLQLAQESDRVTGVCYNVRFYPLNLESRHRVQQESIGSVHSVVGSYVQDWLLYDTDYNWRVLAEQGGALRAVADIGTHWIDLVCFITGMEVEAVCANLQTIHPTRKRPIGEVETFSGKVKKERKHEEVKISTEDCGGILFRFRGGGQGMLWVSQVTAGRKNCIRYEISGGDGALAWDSEIPNELWLGHRDRANERLGRDPALMADTAGRFAAYPGGHNEGFPDTFKQCFRAFYDSIESKDSSESLCATFEEGHREVVLCEAILKSHQEQTWVTLS